MQLLLPQPTAEDPVSHISGHLGAAKETPAEKSAEMFSRTRPPITTHVLDIAHGSPAAGIEVLLKTWGDNQSRPLFGQMNSSHNWKLQSSSTTDKDGRSGQLMKMVDALIPRIYRISFNIGRYNPTGFFPYVSIVFKVGIRKSWSIFMSRCCFLHFHSALTVGASCLLLPANET